MLTRLWHLSLVGIPALPLLQLLGYLHISLWLFATLYLLTLAYAFIGYLAWGCAIMIQAEVGQSILALTARFIGIPQAAYDFEAARDTFKPKNIVRRNIRGAWNMWFAWVYPLKVA